MENPDTRRRIILVALALAVATLITWWPVRLNAFINYDDPDYITQNPMVLQGLTLPGIGSAFGFHAANWHPLTWISHMLDVTLFGLDPAGHHLMTLFIHTANAVLIFVVLRALTGATWRSALVAAIFALHPLRVESVAWASERKDVLSTFFWFLCLWAYARYARQPDRQRFALVAVLFVFGLMSKPMVVTLPFVLLLMDIWPLRRIQIFTPPGDAAAGSWRTGIAPLLLEKIPLFILSALACVATVFAQRSGGAIRSLETLPLAMRMNNSIVSVARYLGKIFWPTKLSVYYTMPDEWPLLAVVGALVLMFAVFYLAWRCRQNCPWLAFGWLWFLGTLFPVIGLVQVGAQAMADRYTYLPSIGICIAIVWTLADWTAAWPRRKIIQSAAAGAALAACAMVTRETIGHWRNSEALFTQALPINTQNVLIHLNLGNALFEEGEMDEAVDHYKAALKIRPHYAAAHFNWGNVLARQQRWEEAAAHYDEALHFDAGYKDARINLANVLSALGEGDKAVAQLERLLQSDPDDARVHNNLGNALVALGKWNEAFPHFQRALELNPANTDALDNWGAVLADQGKAEEAERFYLQALKIKPTDARAHNELGRICADRNQFPEATAHYLEALKLDPTMADAHLNLGMLLAVAGRTPDAKVHFEDALKLRPNSAEAHNNLGFVLVREGKIDDAIQQYTEAIRLKPTLANALNSLARIHAAQPDVKFRNGMEAIKLAEKACELTARQQPLFLDTLAAAYAEAGKFPEAVATQQQALELIRRGGETPIAAQFQQRLELYQSGKPLREP